MDQTPRERFLSSHSGKKLLETHSLNDKGTWQIIGEDPNCDFSGPHHSPTLGFREGVLSDVIDEAVTMPAFWVWGYGGEIRAVNVIKVAPTEAEEVEVTLSLRVHRPKDIPMEQFMEQMSIVPFSKIGKATVESRTFTPK